MSADNYYNIVPHPQGGFAAVMRFASDDDTQPFFVRDGDAQFATAVEACEWADGQNPEYGVRVLLSGPHEPRMVSAAGAATNVPAFLFEDTEAFGRSYIKAGVQDASHGTYVDFFLSGTAATTWITDVLVAYFGHSYTAAADLTREAYKAAVRAGLVS